jgi:tetrathionate reductase subunit B
LIQYAMVIDLNRCVGCHSCSVACKAEWNVPAESGRSWLRRLGPDETPYGISYTFYPGHCNHCNEPACVPVCPVEKVSARFENKLNGEREILNIAATWKDPFNGTVQIDKKRCIGCGACVDACPYGARYINPNLGKKGVADKCSFCVERLAKGLSPACVQTCLGGARFFGDLNDPDSEVAKYIDKGALALNSNKINTGSNVYYYGNKKDLYLLTETCTPR